MINEEKISADLTVNLIMIPDYMRVSISQENCVVYTLSDTARAEILGTSSRKQGEA